MIRKLSWNPSPFPAFGDVVIVGRAGEHTVRQFTILDAATDHEIACGFERLADAIRWVAAYAAPSATYAVWHLDLTACGASIGPSTYLGSVVGAQS